MWGSCDVEQPPNEIRGCGWPFIQLISRLGEDAEFVFPKRQICDTNEEGLLLKGCLSSMFSVDIPQGIST